MPSIAKIIFLIIQGAKKYNNNNNNNNLLLFGIRKNCLKSGWSQL
jgi:hypothetical protein